MNPDVSIVLCTYNRSRMLADTLASWQSVASDGITVEFIVVDNASTDDTRAVTLRYQPGFRGTLHYVHEPTPGLSFARNRGMDAASGDLVAYVDDDIYFDPGWLTAMVGAFRDHPEAACVGGNTIPVFEEEPPPLWVTPAILKFYGSTQSGDTDRWMTFPEHPFGVNMMFRRQILEQTGKFNTDLGRIGYSLLSNEEKDYFYRIHEAGLGVYYAAGAIIRHRVAPERVQRPWLLRRAYWQGISNVIFYESLEPRPVRAKLRAAFVTSKRAILGSGHHTLKGLYAFYRNFSFADRLHSYQLLGAARQNLVEIFRRTP